MTTTETIADNHWRVFMAAQHKCDVTVEVRMPRGHADRLVEAVAAGAITGLDAPDPPIPTAVMMKLMT